KFRPKFTTCVSPPLPVCSLSSLPVSPRLTDSAITTLPDARPAFATSGLTPPTAALASSTAATETAKASRLPTPTSSRLAAMERTVSVAAG
ncbi:hypothetical protein BGZ52_004119, partial [Haplosporangium bisporale]